MDRLSLPTLGRRWRGLERLRPCQRHAVSKAYGARMRLFLLRRCFGNRKVLTLAAGHELLQLRLFVGLVFQVLIRTVLEEHLVDVLHLTGIPVPIRRFLAQRLLLLAFVR